jgi:hypothetical protein
MNRSDVDRTKLVQVVLTLAIIGSLALLAGSIVSSPEPADVDPTTAVARAPVAEPVP